MTNTTTINPLLYKISQNLDRYTLYKFIFQIYYQAFLSLKTSTISIN